MSATRPNILDRLIPCRAETNMQMAQHLLSPMSHRAECHHYSEQHSRQVTPILTFGNKVVRVKPMASLACGTTLKSKFEFPTLPHRVMVAREPFNQYEMPMMQSTHWAPSPNFVVALEDGVYVYNENYKKTTVCIHDVEDDPFCHVLWAGDSIIIGSYGGESAIRDLNTSDHHIKWGLSLENGIYSMALGQDHLLTVNCVDSNEVGVYDLRQTGSILSLLPDFASISLSWSPNGNFLAVGCQSGISLWDVRQPSKEMNFLRNTDESLVRVMNWCPWKSNILCSGTGYTGYPYSTMYRKPSIRLHNATTGKLIDDYECVSTVTGIQFNVELEQVATSHDLFPISDVDQTHDIPGTESCVQLWEFTSNKLNPIQKISYHEEGIISMAASANSSQLLTLGGDEKLCLWNWKNKTKQPLIQMRTVRRDSRPLVVSWMHSTLFASPRF